MPIDGSGKFVPEKRTHSNAATQKYTPLGDVPKDKIKERKAKFEVLNEHIQKHGGWTTSYQGEREIRFECLPGSPLPADLRGCGYNVQPDGVGERILPHSIVEWFVRAGDGSLELLTAESTKPPASRVTHAGVAKVEKFYFDLS